MEDKEKDLPEETPARKPDPAAEESATEERPPSPAEGADELAEVRNRLVYLAAEFDNYRKRIAREKEALVSFGNERLLRAILPFLDNLERAMALAGASGSPEGLLSGVRMTYEQFLAELRKFGLTQISAEGEMFDPNLHEAIALVPWEGKPDGTVLSEARKGYLLSGRLLRPAQVTVAQAPPAAQAPKRDDGLDEDLPGGES
ncbi:MAG: nucleotide exchange factor GrpE [Deltaproteobacteria bacterium]|nr:nucleotide exchange factor GrpE [Deltaproteobacteria bacterium]